MTIVFCPLNNREDNIFLTEYLADGEVNETTMLLLDLLHWQMADSEGGGIMGEYSIALVQKEIVVECEGGILMGRIILKKDCKLRSGWFFKNFL